MEDFYRFDTLDAYKERTFYLSLKSGVCRTFTSVTVLRLWLKKKMSECGSPEGFIQWLDDYFNEGNEISVRGEHYSYADCLELV